MEGNLCSKSIGLALEGNLPFLLCFSIFFFYLKAFPVFNVLKTCREYFLTIDLGIIEFIKKIYRAVFGKMRNF